MRRKVFSLACCRLSQPFNFPYRLPVTITEYPRLLSSSPTCLLHFFPQYLQRWAFDHAPAVGEANDDGQQGYSCKQA